MARSRLEPDSKAYVLARRLRASWIEAIATKAARVSARFSKSLARRRLRPNQEKVRSTTQRRAVAVLHGGGMDDHPHGQALDIDEGVQLAAVHLLGGVITHCVVFAAPFSADFGDRPSSAAAVGPASRPRRSRSAMCSSAQIASQTPSRWNLRKML